MNVTRRLPGLLLAVVAVALLAVIVGRVSAGADPAPQDTSPIVLKTPPPSTPTPTPSVTPTSDDDDDDQVKPRLRDDDDDDGPDDDDRFDDRDDD